MRRPGWRTKNVLRSDVPPGYNPRREERYLVGTLTRQDERFNFRLSKNNKIIFKAVAHRLKDLIDIQTLVEVYPDLDRSRIERWVRDFADTLESPDLWDDLAPLLKPA